MSALLKCLCICNLMHVPIKPINDNSVIWYKIQHFDLNLYFSNYIFIKIKGNQLICKVIASDRNIINLFH
jgi:hypothetical protein